MNSIIIVLTISTCVVFCKEETNSNSYDGDSYLEAYKKSQSESVEANVKKIDREYQVSGNEGYPYPTPQGQYGPPQYGPPNPNAPVYGPPAPPPSYGPPAPPPSYGPPVPPPAYGPPAPPPAYGPPAPPPVYGPPIYGPPSSSVQVYYGVPHALGSFWDKLKLKLSLFTLGKILLKLVIFKKIVSFIAILCLLLLIPSLKNKDESSPANDDERRNVRAWAKLDDEAINNMTEFVLKALSNTSFEQKNAVTKH